MSSRDALTRLVHDAHALPGLPETTDSPRPRGADRRMRAPRPSDALEPQALKTRVRELLFELARRVDDKLPGALDLADGAWDQIDALRLLDKAIDDELAALQRASRLLAAEDDVERRALGLEAQLTLEAAVGLTSLIERRIATLVRLRLRAHADDAVSPALLSAGRPFLDLGAALHETARRWT